MFEKIPYLITILVALIGWGLTHTVDRVISFPIIEYNKKINSNEKGKEIEYFITNISRDTLFQNLTFEFLLKEGEYLVDHCDVEFILPMTSKERPNKGEDFFSITLAEFHPQWKFIIKLKTLGKAEPKFIFHTESVVETSNKQPIILHKSSLQTFLVKHEFRIIFGMIITWIIVIILTLFFSRKNRITEIR